MLCSKNELSSTPQGGMKATEQKLIRSSLDYKEPVSSHDTDKNNPIYEDVEASAQQLEGGDVTIENPDYVTNVF